MTLYPSSQTPERVAAYLDGFNIYNGMMAKGWGSYRWLDYRALLHRYMRGSQQLVAVKLFTSPMTQQPDRHGRQKVYLQALDVRGGIEIVRGEFVTQTMQCRKCGERFKVPKEKRTDVNMAMHLVADAFDGRFDTFALCTADTDLLPAIAYVKERFGKRFMLIDPPRRHADALAAVADLHLHSRRYYLSQSQLPDPVEYLDRRGKIKRIHRPASWGTPHPAAPFSDPDDDGFRYCLTCGQAVMPDSPWELFAELEVLSVGG